MSKPAPLITALLLGLISLNAQAGPKRVLMIVNEGFQAQEYYVPRKLFEAEGFNIQTASRFGGTVHPGKRTALTPAVQTDLAFAEVKVSRYDAVVLAGGGGAWTDYFPNLQLHKLMKEAVSDPNRVVALICAAAGVLATIDNLNGQTPHFKDRHVTGYPEVEGLLRLVGRVNYDGGIPGKPFVVTDGNLVTGRDPLSAELFGKAVIKVLSATRLSHPLE